MEFYIWPVAQDFQFFSNRVCDILSFPDIYYPSIMAQMCRGLIINWFHLLCGSPKPLKSWRGNASSSPVPWCLVLGTETLEGIFRSLPSAAAPLLCAVKRMNGAIPLQSVWMICVVIAHTVWKTHSNITHKLSERATGLRQIMYKGRGTWWSGDGKA